MQMKPVLTGGLYVLTDADLIPDAGLMAAVEQAILGGARLVQYRDKSNDTARRLQQARDLQALCRRYGVPLLINDDVELALQAGAAGVHLGKDDAPLTAARARLGASACIGVSCYNELERAPAAVAAGADYVAFGSFHPSATKPAAVTAEIKLLLAARRCVPVPIVAIGGITPANGGRLIAAGADYLAVVQGVFGQADIRAAARAYSDLFGNCKRRPMTAA